MNQDLGQVFAKDAKFTIYSMGTEITGMYFVCVPNDLKSSLKVFVDLHKKDDFNVYREISDPLRREELVAKLRDVNDFINGMNHSGIYVMPVIDMVAVESLNDQSKSEEFNRIFKMIASCTKDVSEKLNSVSNGQRTIEQAITIIEQSESDKQFVAWLKQQFPNFVMGITLDDLRKQYEVEHQIVNQNVDVANVNMNAIEDNIISNDVATVQSNVNVSNDTVVSMAQENVQNGNTVQSLNNNANVIGQVDSHHVQGAIVQPGVEESQVQSSLSQSTVSDVADPITKAPIVHIQSNGITPVDHSLDDVAYQQQQAKSHTLTKTPNNSRMGSIARAGFVKFPVFLLTIMAIGALGIFVGKMFYTYLSQK